MFRDFGFVFREFCPFSPTETPIISSRVSRAQTCKGVGAVATTFQITDHHTLSARMPRSDTLRLCLCL